jgi:transcription initiation factor TFIIIB Brf1 subunit/transcription initiation factor TFIIB
MELEIDYGTLYDMLNNTMSDEYKINNNNDQYEINNNNDNNKYNNKYNNDNNYNNNKYNDNDDNNKNKVEKYCEDCQTNNIIEDVANASIICMDCGKILNLLLDTNAEWLNINEEGKKGLNRCGSTINKLLPQSSMATTIRGYTKSRLKTLHGWSAMPYKERSLNEVFKKIQAKCEEAGIIKCIEDDAKIIYKNLSESKHLDGKNIGKNIIIRGVNRRSLIAACVLFACKRKGKSRSPKEIAKIFNLKNTEITKGCKMFQKMAKLTKIDLHTSNNNPEQFIMRFCDELKIKNEYAEQAIQISKNVEKLCIASVHTPLSLATGSIYLMIVINGLDIHKKVIASKFNVSQVTIAKAYKKLEPFIKILTNDKICDNLNKKIKIYQSDISIADSLKPKFLRFGIINDNIMNLYDKNSNSLNLELINKFNMEIDNKNQQLDNEFIRINFLFDNYRFNNP